MAHARTGRSNGRRPASLVRTVMLSTTVSRQRTAAVATNRDLARFE
jgi:hypothetical protein